MSIIFSHQTALQIYAQLKINGNEDAIDSCTNKDSKPNLEVTSNKEYAEAIIYLNKRYGIVLPPSTHEIKPSHTPCVRSLFRMLHQFDFSLSQETLINLGRDCFCTCPAFSMLLLSKHMSKLEQLTLTNVLLSSFGHQTNGKLIQFRSPLLTLSDVDYLTNNLSAFSVGIEKIKQNKRYYFPLAASPMEIKLAIRSALPYKFGGFNQLPLALNKKVNVQSNKSPKHITHERKLDIVFGNPKNVGKGKQNFVALEYNGSYHDDVLQNRKDNQRTNELNAIGIKEYFIHSGIYWNADMMRELFVSIKKDLHINEEAKIKKALEKNAIAQSMLMHNLEIIYRNIAYEIYSVQNNNLRR
ncbi:MAG: hypothetical protein HXK61_01680 [Atopobiaceae bacterium]|nr:hypothetical protein [Atopobiaceae bacterium]